MRFLVLFAQAFALSALAAPTSFKRQVVSHQGSGQVSGQVSGQSAAVNNDNVNNGVQLDSTLVNGDGPLPNGAVPENFNPFFMASPPDTNRNTPVNQLFGGIF